MATGNGSTTPIQTTNRAGVRFFAVLYAEDKGGYALDYLPHEEARFRRAHGDRIIGDFATAEEALSALHHWTRS